MVESCRVLLYCKFTNIIGAVKVDHDWPRFRGCCSQKEKIFNKATYTKMDLSLPILLSVKMSLRLRLITLTALFLHTQKNSKVVEKKRLGGKTGIR